VSYFAREMTTSLRYLAGRAEYVTAMRYT